MADEPKDRPGLTRSAADKDKLQTPGRQDNAAQPLSAPDDQGGPERYPAVRQDDAVERTGRTEQVAGEHPSFDPANDAASQPPRDPDDTSAPPGRADRLGPRGDPAEGKR